MRPVDPHHHLEDKVIDHRDHYRGQDGPEVAEKGTPVLDFEVPVHEIEDQELLVQAEGVETEEL
jgi:hypothetical protein